MKREIIAILRGIKPNEVLAVAHSIADSGITQIEVTMNSPDVFDSIKLLCDEFRDDIQIGAGTVTNTKQVETLSDIGGVRFIVSPNFDSEVVEATKKMGMMSFPGVITPTECFSALKSGADGLKFFPATLLGEANLSALKAVLPQGFLCIWLGESVQKTFYHGLMLGQLVLELALDYTKLVIALKLFMKKQRLLFYPMIKLNNDH